MLKGVKLIQSIKGIVQALCIIFLFIGLVSIPFVDMRTALGIGLTSGVLCLIFWVVNRE